MNGTLYALDLLQSGAGFMVAGLIGILFGFFLEQAGLGSSRRLTGVFYLRDMTALKVMLTTVVVTLVGYHYLVALGWLSPAQVYALDTYWISQIIGGLIFGIGFVMGGWCPGTAFVGLANAKLDALVFLIGVVIGSILFNEVFGLIRPLYEGMHKGQMFLYDTLNLPLKPVILASCLIAVAVFVVCSLIEKAVPAAPKAPPRAWRHHAIAAAVLILFAGGLFVMPQRAPVSVKLSPRAGYLEQIDEARDHVDPLELADLIMKGEPGLIVVDVRSHEDYQKFHLRHAVNIPLADLSRAADKDLPRSGLIVLYSNGTTHAAQAWLEMRHWGWSNVKVLTDGLLGFWRECLTPPSLHYAGDEQTAEQERAAYQARRDFFMPSEK